MSTLGESLLLTASVLIATGIIAGIITLFVWLATELSRFWGFIGITIGVLSLWMFVYISIATK